MNRTDRLYALVEDLRAVAPRRRSARELAARYEVSVRTIERDICALQESGVPIYADVGRAGGYTLDKRMSLPPLNFTPAETVAVATALVRLGGTPFEAAGSAALAKMLAAMPDESACAAKDLARRVHLLGGPDLPPPARFAGVVRHAVTEARVLELRYADRFGASSARVVEPIALMWGREGWYLLGWCRLREGARLFRLDRIVDAVSAGPVLVRRALDSVPDLPPGQVLRPIEL